MDIEESLPAWTFCFLGRHTSPSFHCETLQTARDAAEIDCNFEWNINSMYYYGRYLFWQFS